jgi:hypothetical protein
MGASREDPDRGPDSSPLSGERAGADLAGHRVSVLAADDADEEESESGRLRPTYEPRPPPEKDVYTTDYLFAITRAVSESTLVPAAQVPLYILTVPLDIAFLPMEAIAGFFPRESN